MDAHLALYIRIFDHLVTILKLDESRIVDQLSLDSERERMQSVRKSMRRMRARKQVMLLDREMNEFQVTFSTEESSDL